MKNLGFTAALMSLTTIVRGYYQEYRLADKLCGQVPDQFGPWPIDSFFLTKTLDFFIPLKSDEADD